MRPEIKALLHNEQMHINLDLHAKDRISTWKKVRCPLRPLLNQSIMWLSKNLFICMGVKRVILRLVGVKIGKRVGIAPNTIDALIPELITIEDDAIIGWHTTLLVHEITQETVRVGKIHVGKKAVIGAKSTIRSGVRIGDGAIVAMNSFVNKDIPPNEVWGGVPARKIK